MGQIRTYDDIVRLDIDEENLQATVVTTEDAQAWAAQNATDPRYFRAREILGCEPEKIFERPRDVRFKASDILACADKLLAELAATHEKTNGVHSGIIWDQQAEKILVFREDIGRHNVFDKLYGWSLRNHVGHHGQDHHLQWALLVRDDDEAWPHGHFHRGREVRADDALAGACQEARHHARRAHGTGQLLCLHEPGAHRLLTGVGEHSRM